MYLGIDLGTSNSAIAGFAGAEARLFKTAEGTDVLPSVISINKLGHRFIGGRAYQQALLSPENVAQGFKRLMGTDSRLTLAASGTSMTPEECSAEIIRCLLSQVTSDAGDIDILGTIVTIPAAFNQMQSEATLRAAQAAGLEHVGLLQEPIAAAMASTARSKNKHGQFLIYDLGGGTFDLALVQSMGGAINVIAHEGVNMLGGRDFDRAIVSTLVRPWLLENFDLPENFQSDPRFRRLIGIARHAAERAKIELSSTEKAVIFAGDEEIRMSDWSGADLYLSVDITRAQLEGMIEEQVGDSIALCRKIVQDSGFSRDDIDRIVLVGGPSKMPAIRNRIAAELGIPADLATDPMTAVAIGAAIFAETREWKAGGTSRKSTRGTAAAPGKLDLHYDYPARTSDDRARIRIRCGPRAEGHRLQIDTLDGWTSGIVDVKPDLVLEVPLPNRGENPCRVTVYDPSGAPLAKAASTLIVTRASASAAGIPATQTLAVKIVERAEGVERNSLEWLIRKGTQLPAEGIKHFRAANDLRGGQPSKLAIELYQQAENVPEPELNLFVGAFIMSGSEHLDHGETLRRGEEVVIRWSMDDSGILNCKIDLPTLGRTFETGKFYASSAGHQNFEGESGLALAKEVLDSAEQELSAAGAIVGAEGRETLGILRRRIQQQRKILALEADADARRAVTEEVRSVRQQISRLRHAPESRAAVLQQKKRNIDGWYDKYLRGEIDSAMAERFAGWTEKAAALLAAGRLEEAEHAIDEMHLIVGRELWHSSKYLISAFRQFVGQGHLAADKPLHDKLTKQGDGAIKDGNMKELADIVWEMRRNLFSVQAQGEAISEFAGLMRA